MKVFNFSNEIYEEKEKNFIQVYCRDLDSSKKAFETKNELDSKTKERIEKFFKKRSEKWKGLKSRVDEQKRIVPDKCL